MDEQKLDTPDLNTVSQTDTPVELTGYTSQIYTQEFDENNPEANKLADGAQISLEDDLYFVLRKSSFEDVQVGIPYRVFLPTPIACFETGEKAVIARLYPDQTSETPIPVEVARVNLVQGNHYIDITFNFVQVGDNTLPERIDLSWLSDLYISFMMNLDKELIQTDENGKIQIDLVGEVGISVIVEEYIPVPPTPPTLSKSNSGMDYLGKTKWNIEYTSPSQSYENKGPYKLTDTLPSGLEFTGIESILIDGQEQNDAFVYDEISNTITFLLPQDIKTFSASYNTMLSKDEFVNYWKTNTQKSYTNTVEAKNEDDSNYTVNSAQLKASSSVSNANIKKIMTKDGSNVEYVAESKEYWVDWTVTINLSGQNLDKLVITDTYNKGLEIPENNRLLNLFIIFNSDLLEDISIPLEKFTHDADKRQFEIDLTEYLDILKQAGSFEVHYQTKIKNEYFESVTQLTKEDLKNTALVNYSWSEDENEYTSSPFTASPGNIDTVLFVKTGGSYDDT